MLLQKLKEYADERMRLPPELYSEVPVRYIIELDSQGRLLSPEPTNTADSSNRSTRRGQPREMPNVMRAVGIRPLLLADKADYSLGLVSEKSKPARVAECHNAYMDLLDRCVTATREPSVEAVACFLRDNPLEQLRLQQDFDPGATITFRVDGQFPTELGSVQAFWAAENKDSDAPIMQCIVCGEDRPVLERLQARVKSVPGGQTAGTSIISANAAAFESYGLEASLIAPTCASCGERFTKAANKLLASDQDRITVGGAAFIFWTREDIGFSWRSYFDNPDPEQVRQLLASPYTGKWTPEIDDVAFYATSLSGSGGRAVVRDWIDTTVGEVKEHLKRWFQLQDIVDPYGNDGRPLGLYALATATVREAGDLGPPTPRALLHAALQGTPVPHGLLYEAVRRNRAEQGITRPRAALIKLALLSNQPEQKEEYMVQLRATASRAGGSTDACDTGRQGDDSGSLLRHGVLGPRLRLRTPVARRSTPPRQARTRQARRVHGPPAQARGRTGQPQQLPANPHTPGAGDVLPRLLPPARFRSRSGARCC